MKSTAPHNGPAAPRLQLAAFRVALQALPTASQAGRGEPPERLLVCPLGSHDARDRGTVLVDELTLSGFAAAMAAARIGPRIALDFEHNTVPGTPAYEAEAEPRRIAAWGVAQATPQGLVLAGLEWTPAGRAAWTEDLFQDISPAVIQDAATGRVLALHSVALCRHGELPGLTLEGAISAAQMLALTANFERSDSVGSGVKKDQTDSVGLVASPAKSGVGAFSHPPGKSNSDSVGIKSDSVGSFSNQANQTMTNPNEKMKHHPALVALLKALGADLAAESDEAAYEAAVTAAAGALEKLQAAAPVALSAQITALQTAVTALTRSDEQLSRQRLLDQATAQGKVIPLSAEQVAQVPLSVLQSLVAVAKPGEVPLGKGVTAEPVKPAVTALSAETLARYKALGVTPEQVAELDKAKAA
ncbi:MAG: phage protease [Aeromonas sp.]